jgi:hypothetical protein
MTLGCECVVLAMKALLLYPTVLLPVAGLATGREGGYVGHGGLADSGGDGAGTVHYTSCP